MEPELEITKKEVQEHNRRFKTTIVSAVEFAKRMAKKKLAEDETKMMPGIKPKPETA